MTNYNKEIVLQIKDIVIQHRKSFANVLKSSKYRHLYEYVLEATKQFNLQFTERLYWIFNNMTSRPICVVCKEKEISHAIRCDPIDGYKSHCCSQSCAQKNPETQQKIIAKSQAKYGTDRPSQAKEVKDKISKTKKSKTPEEKQATNEKREKTCMCERGVKNVSQDPKVRAKKHDTMVNKSQEEKDARTRLSKQTCKKRYGDENYVNIEKAAETRKRHKVENPNYLQDILDKRIATCRRDYGCDYVLHTAESKQKSFITNKTKRYNRVISNNKFVVPLFTLEEYLANPDNVFKWQCKKCGDIFESTVFEHQKYVAQCEKCYPISEPYSKMEKDIEEWLKTIYDRDIIGNSRKIIPPRELDIYLPNEKFGIEFDGLYWHSLSGKGQSTYHLSKTQACEKKGIQLIHVFENEWMLKQDIVKSNLKALIGKLDKTIYANDCIIKEVSCKESKHFQTENCIQDPCNSSVNLGLFFNNELISLMTFIRCRFNKKYEWEMQRFCNKLNIKVIGSAEKLLTYFESIFKPKSLVCYVDRRWSNGKLQKDLGFNYVKTSRPNYWYWNYKGKFMCLESSVKFKKSKLASLLKTYDASLSVYQNMANNGYMRIFDCGNLVYVKNYF